MNRFIIPIFCIAFSIVLSAPAQAQQRELKSGLNYTTLAKPKAQDAQPAEEAEAENPSEKEEEIDPATAVWNKYKDLATGTAKDEESEKSTEAPDKPEKPSVEIPEKPTLNGKSQDQAQQGQEESQQNAFSAILEEWKSSKENQREMRSKSFTVPEPRSK
ncbi:MAG: hypothetical protein AAF204_04455 [Pseudomonadota bacterium]